MSDEPDRIVKWSVLGFTLPQLLWRFVPVQIMANDAFLSYLSTTESLSCIVIAQIGQRESGKKYPNDIS